MIASVLSGNKFQLIDIERPNLNTKGAIIKVIGCGLCGSDIVKYTHNLVPNGTVLGHEVVGEIIEINSKNNFKVGDTVVVAHHYPCFNCNFCKHENYSMCATFKQSNIIPGGFSEYIKIDENHLKYTVFKIPKDMDIIKASFTEPLACCHRAVARMNILKNDKILIVGLGSIGILMGQLCKLKGAKVYGLDINTKRLNLAKNYSFDETINANEQTENLNVDGVFLTAGANESVNNALKHIRAGGKICVFSSTNTDTPSFPNNEIYYKELTVYGSYSPSPDNLKKAFELLKTNQVNTQNITTTYDIENLNIAISDTKKSNILKAFIRINK